VNLLTYFSFSFSFSFPKVTKFSLVCFLVMLKPLNDNLVFAKLSPKKTDVSLEILETLNFEDEISIRRGECNTPIKATFY
jgi:hypothetical protein